MITKTTQKPAFSAREQLQKIDRELKFKRALSRIHRPKQKIKGKQWIKSEFGFLYLTPEEHIKFLINVAQRESQT